jgi:hypothetical protein
MTVPPDHERDLCDCTDRMSGTIFLLTLACAVTVRPDRRPRTRNDPRTKRNILRKLDTVNIMNTFGTSDKRAAETRHAYTQQTSSGLEI